MFAMHLTDGQYLFGRVVATDATVSGGAKLNLVYVFKYRSRTMSPPRHLSAKDLLIAPEITNRQGWLKGYWQTIESRAFEEGERLAVHCFFDETNGRYVDEYGKRLAGRKKPSASLGVAQYHGIGYSASKKLGLPMPTMEEYMEQFDRVEKEFKRRAR